MDDNRGSIDPGRNQPRRLDEPPSGAGRVRPPRLPDGPTGKYIPRYTVSDENNPVPLPAPAAQEIPPPVAAAHPRAPQQPVVAPWSDAAPTGPRRWTLFAAPAAAGLVLLAGIGFLVLRNGDDPIVDGREVRTTRETDPGAAATTTESAPPSETVSASTPAPTSPPVIQPPVTLGDPRTTLATDPATTLAPAPPPGPTADEVRGALLRVDDLENSAWEPTTLDETTEDPCGENPDAASATVDETVLFSRFDVDPIEVRQISSTIVSYPDIETATRAFESDIQLIRNCNDTTTVIEGITYDVSVEVSRFTDAEIGTFFCADDSVLFVAQFTSDGASVPFLGISTTAIRCGVNVMVVSFGSTAGLADLTDRDYVAGTVVSNLRLSNLAGSA